MGLLAFLCVSRPFVGVLLPNWQQVFRRNFQKFAVPMSLLQRENSRDGGGSQENRHSLAENLNFDASQFSRDAAAPEANLSNGQECGGWCGEQPCSAEAAQSPGALGPDACFPSRGDPAHFTSFSELDHPGGWSSEPYQEIGDLVESFRALAAPARRHSIHTRIRCELTLESSWLPEGEPLQWQDGRASSRRASSCGAPERGSLLTWSGNLLPRCTDANPAGGFSPKVFMGGLPRNFSKEALKYALREFQPVHVEWPGHQTAPRGCAYVTLESERHVRALLHASRRDGTKWIYRVTSHAMRTKDVEVIPWAVADSHWMHGVGALTGGAASVRLEPSRTVFVGALHGIISASALALIMNNLFSGVVYAGIDIDKNKYPIGSGRVTFSNVRSYMCAVTAGRVEIRTGKFTKEIQVDPYLEESMCSVCNLHLGPYFCREPVCFRYYCRSCWAWQHPSNNHKALMRNYKSVTVGNGNSGGFTETHATPAPSTSPRSAECGDSPLAPD